jgi:hypothetical protein
MREEIFIDKDQETILQDEDTIVQEDFSHSQDSQEYMHWEASLLPIWEKDIYCRK